ncbi:hypothetical protein CBS101457_004134 [Exobasidium rhododendri]|nr:hypothetical protein CBS101457_004134 [Exobasidium rhododendri]
MSAPSNSARSASPNFNDDQFPPELATPITPVAARNRGFSFFQKRTMSSETRSPTLNYQPRLNRQGSYATNNVPQNQQRRAPVLNDVGDATPRASTSSLDMAPLPSMKRVVPGRIEIADSAKQMQKELDENQRRRGASQSGAIRSPASPKSPRRTSMERRREEKTEKLEGPTRPGRDNNHRRKLSWIPHHDPLPRTKSKRTISTSLGMQAERNGKEAVQGAKPVTASFHPDAPSALKVKPPSHSVLLPHLSIPGMKNKGDTTPSTSVDSPVSPPDFKADDVIKSKTIKLQRPGIKVRIVTWNQGSSVPKGNLEVLLGRVGEYIPPQEDWDMSGDEEEKAEEEGKGVDGSDEKHKYRGMGVAGQEKIPRKERIPPLPHDDAHPYHVVVIAGQECPWGDGKRIATGVGMAGELGDLGRSKSRAAQVAKGKEAALKEKERREGARGPKEGEAPAIVLDTRGGLSALEGEFPFSDAGKSSVPSTPAIAIPTTPGAGAGVGAGLGAGAWGIGGKGWSDMCEDWLCRGPLAQATATKGLAQASKGFPISPIVSPAITPDDGMSPLGSRSHTPNPPSYLRNSDSIPSLHIQTQSLMESGKPQSQGPASNNVIAQDHFYNSPPKRTSLVVPRREVSRSTSFLTRSREAMEGTTSSSSLVEEEEGVSEDDVPLHSSPTSRPLSPIKQVIDTNVRLPAHQQRSLAGKPHHRLGLHIPGLSAAHHVTVQSDGTPLSLGAYELVAKERCYMMYMAVYVWRGCIDRVNKTSQGHVKSGLLAGRVGNKGAVGISLKLGSSRLLFVNAHLAAHEGKVAERVANVEKIKKELKVDTFLPEGDPRNKADDLTAAFDYAFWFGDLNFRVDISRQHADWLLMKKQYHDALAFDQLTKLMKEQPKVFNGFHEATITFPPTFKYDVLKTIKQKREEKAKRYKNSAPFPKSAESEGSSGIDASRFSAQSGDSMQNLSQSMSGTSTRSNGKVQRGNIGDACDNDDDDDDDDDDGKDLEDDDDDDDDMGQSRFPNDDHSSFASSTWGGSALAASMRDHHSDQEDTRNSLSSFKEADLALIESTSPIDPIVQNNTAAAERHNLHGRAIKVKKKILDVVYSLGYQSPKSKDDHLPQIVKTARLIKEKRQKEQDAVDQDLSGTVSNLQQEGGGGSLHEKRNVGRAASDELLSANSARHSRVDSHSTTASTSQKMPSLERRASSAADLAKDCVLDAEKEKNGSKGTEIVSSSSIIAMAEEYERQPYDTSAKQRVPSWCDRVLWKSNIVVVEETEEEAKDGEGVLMRSEAGSNAALHSRVGTAISNALGTHHRRDSSRTNRAASPSVTFASPPISPFAEQTNTIESQRTDPLTPPIETPSDPISDHKRRWFTKKERPQHMKRSTTMEPHELIKLQNQNIDTGIKAMSDIDLPSLNRSGSNGHYRGAKERMPTLTSRNSSLEISRRRLQRISTIVQDNEGSPSRQANVKQRIGSPHHSHPLPSFAESNSSTNNTNRGSSWWNDHVGAHLPFLLTPQVAMHAHNGRFSRTQADAELNEEEKELIGPRRGQIECMLYKSLDDREMRLLEGRSDHRPVIWVGNVGI